MEMEREGGLARAMIGYSDNNKLAKKVQAQHFLLTRYYYLFTLHVDHMPIVVWVKKVALHEGVRVIIESLGASL